MSGLTGMMLTPFGSFDPIWGLVFVSAVTGVLLLLVFGRVSNQAAIRAVKRSIYAALLESVLFRHDIRLCLGAQSRLVKHSFQYFLTAVPPVLVLAVPCILVMAQLNLRYDARGFAAGEKGLVKLELDDPRALYDVSLSAPTGVEVSKPLRIPATKEVIWRISAAEGAPESAALAVSVAGKRLEVPLVLGVSSAAETAAVYRDWWWSVLYPAELDLGSLPVKGLSIGYPKLDYPVFDVHMHWLVIFLIVSLLSGLVASRVFKVEI